MAPNLKVNVTTKVYGLWKLALAALLGKWARKRGVDVLVEQTVRRA